MALAAPYTKQAYVAWTMCPTWRRTCEVCGLVCGTRKRLMSHRRHRHYAELFEQGRTTNLNIPDVLRSVLADSQSAHPETGKQGRAQDPRVQTGEGLPDTGNTGSKWADNLCERHGLPYRGHDDECCHALLEVIDQ